MTGALDQDANFLVGTTSVVRLVVVRHGHSSRGARTVHRRAPMGDPDRLHPRSRVYPPGSLTAAPKSTTSRSRESLVNLGVLPNPSRVSGALQRCVAQFLLGGTLSSPDRRRMEQIGTGFRAFRQRFPHIPTRQLRDSQPCGWRQAASVWGKQQGLGDSESMTMMTWGKR